MHDTDDFDDDFTGPSRSQLRRDALDIFKLAEALASLSDAQLARVPLDDDLREEVLRTRAVTSHIARKRQTQFLAKQMRKLDDEALEAIRKALAHDRVAAHREAAALHRVEAWRERLLEEGDDALAEFVAAHPSVDRQHLRQLVRNAVAERKANKPPHAQRELFRVLRDAAAAAAGETSADDEAD
ncbi:ribosome biogenesis factor YjgA [Dokdonella ginsengisoli]|uniref:Dual-action ribosomal maturation protein DarP n=1 Tax=Dokdonella ginsengisoli TaxID=363846 RepID=A0ABV9QVF2_9GAMM